MSMGPVRSPFVGGGLEQRGGLVSPQPQGEKKRRVLGRVTIAPQTEAKASVLTLPQSATVYQEHPLAPIFDIHDPIPLAPGPEPAPWTASPEEWAIWVRSDNAHRAYKNLIAKRDKAEAYALENDLRGVPFN